MRQNRGGVTRQARCSSKPKTRTKSPASWQVSRTRMAWGRFPCPNLDMATPHLVEVSVSALHEQLASLRLCEPRAVDAIELSLTRHGQLTPVEVFAHDGELQVLDGFKRLQAARRLGWKQLRTQQHDLSTAEAIVMLVQVHGNRSLAELEEAWLVRALVREHGLTQGAVGERLGRHKSWVCRRMILAEGLEPQVQAWVRLGLVVPRAAVELAALPRGNQSVAGELVMKRGLTVRQTQLLVHQLVEADGAQQQQLLSRWSEQGAPSGQVAGRPAVRKARSEADWMSTDILTLHRSAARLQARLMGNGLYAAPEGLRELMGESLRALVPVLQSLKDVIAEHCDGHRNRNKHDSHLA